MSNQLNLFAERPTIDAEFEAFDAANPQVYQAILYLARRRKAAGYGHWSMQAIFSILRHAQDFQTTGTEVPNIGKVKLSDHFTAMYSRKVMAEFPEFQGFFELRRRPSVA